MNTFTLRNVLTGLSMKTYDQYNGHERNNIQKLVIKNRYTFLYKNKNFKKPLKRRKKKF